MNRSCEERGRHHWRRGCVIAVMAGVLVMAMPRVSLAAGEITGVIGGLVGGDLNNVISGNASVKGAFDNGPLYGVRVGWLGRFAGIEGSFVASPSGVKVSTQSGAGVDAKVYYLEGNVLLIPIPGPVSPFFTAGLGMHSYNFDVGEDIQKLGWNFGGGIKVNIKAVTLRGEVRDHITTLKPGDFKISNIVSDLGDSATMHNVEISGGIGVRF